MTREQRAKIEELIEAYRIYSNGDAFARGRANEAFPSSPETVEAEKVLNEYLDSLVKEG